MYVSVSSPSPSLIDAIHNDYFSLWSFCNPNSPALPRHADAMGHDALRKTKREKHFNNLKNPLSLDCAVVDKVVSHGDMG